jgi:DNA-binding transcriptional LysR family regulator
MRLRQIEVFHAIYTCGSITAAAKLLNVSQPSVSKVLAHAELQLGFALFDRQKGRVIPTQEAERLIPHVNDAYDNINELRRIAQNLRASDTGRIRVAVIPAFGIDLLPAAVASYLKIHPETTFEIETLTGKFTVLTHESVLSKADQSLSLEDLDGLPLVNLSKRSPLGMLLGNHIETSKIKFHSVARVETYQMAKALVAHGAGVAIVDEITARSMGHDNVVARGLEPELQFKIAMLSNESEPLSIVAQKFVEHLASAIADFLKPR